MLPRACVIKLFGRRRKYLETSHNPCGQRSGEFPGKTENKGQTKCCTLGFGARTSCTTNDFLELTALFFQKMVGEKEWDTVKEHSGLFDNLVVQ